MEVFGESLGQRQEVCANIEIGGERGGRALAPNLRGSPPWFRSPAADPALFEELFFLSHGHQSSYGAFTVKRRKGKSTLTDSIEDVFGDTTEEREEAVMVKPAVHSSAPLRSLAKKAGWRRTPFLRRMV